MKVYKVGGCVRDHLLGLKPKDIDYVVVGATEQEMYSLGFQKVGASFPVFLKDGEEYALARKERKVGVGYNGFDVVFDPSVTLEEDLSRRDLTINAMAQDVETGEIIDPFSGRADLQRGLLRHVSDAFAEDPVRVLRTARFAARYGFDIAINTSSLMSKVVEELDHVPQERIWAEVEKGLAEENPILMFKALLNAGAFNEKAMWPYRGIDGDCLRAVQPSTPLVVRFAVCASTFTKADYERCKIPTEFARVASAFNETVDVLLNYEHRSAEDRVKMFQRLRAFNDTAVLDAVLEAFTLTKSKGVIVAPVIKKVRHDLAVLRSVDAAEVVGSLCDDRKSIAATLFATRCQALQSHPHP